MARLLKAAEVVHAEECPSRVEGLDCLPRLVGQYRQMVVQAEAMGYVEAERKISVSMQGCILFRGDVPYEVWRRGGCGRVVVTPVPCR